MDRGELDLFDQTLQRLTDAHTGAALDAALAEVGWWEAVEEDPYTAVGLLFARQGQAGATSGALDDLLDRALGQFTPGGAVLLPAIDRWHPPATVSNGRLSVDGLAAVRLKTAATVTVVASSSEGEMMATLETPDMTAQAVAGMDPRMELVRVSADLPVGGVTIAPCDRWDEAVRWGRVALGHELVGAAAAMLELARAHARDRVQFGRPIGSFQAVQRHLADTLVSIEAARALLDAARVDPTGGAARTAKAVAGHAALSASRHCQQVLAGVGFTTEHPFHHFFRRALLLDQLLGSARTLTTALGTEVLADRRLPSPLPL
jgi:hypothetical protein